MKVGGAAIATEGNSTCKGLLVSRPECAKHVHRLGRTPLQLELSEPRGEWQGMRSETEARDCRPRNLEFILRAMGRDCRVEGKVVICADLCFRKPLCFSVKNRL